MAGRIPHLDAPSLADLVPDPAGFVASDLFHRATRSAGDASGRDPSRFATVAGLWDDVLGRHARTPAFRLVQDGATLAPAGYTRSAGVGHRTITDVVEPNRVVELHRAGATMVLQGLQLTDPHLGRFANNLALALDHPVQVNAYLTPASARVLELHFDFHDVFVVQLEGHKRWRVWAPLDRTRDPVRGDAAPPMPTFGELGPPELDVVLAPGDVLSLPRGFPHCAETLDDASAHLTVGVMAVTWQRVVRHVIDTIGAGARLTASVPARALDAGIDGAAAIRALGDVADGLVDEPALRAWMAHEVWRRHPATRRVPLTPPTVAADRPVDVTPGPLLWLTSSGAATGRIRMGLGDRHLDLPDEAGPMIAALLAAPHGFVAADWEGALDAGSRQVVLERLALEGVVVPGPV